MAVMLGVTLKLINLVLLDRWGEKRDSYETDYHGVEKYGEHDKGTLATRIANL